MSSMIPSGNLTSRNRPRFTVIFFAHPSKATWSWRPEAARKLLWSVTVKSEDFPMCKRKIMKNRDLTLDDGYNL